MELYLLCIVVVCSRTFTFVLILMCFRISLNKLQFHVGGGFETHFCNFPAWRHHPTECPATVPQCTVTHCDGKMQNIREWSRAGLSWAGLGWAGQRPTKTEH